MYVYILNESIVVTEYKNRKESETIIMIEEPRHMCNGFSVADVIRNCSKYMKNGSQFFHNTDNDVRNCASQLNR